MPLGTALTDDRSVHVALHGAGYEPGRLESGSFERTVLMRFQIDNGLTPTGRADEFTRRQLRTALTDAYPGLLRSGSVGRSVETLHRALVLSGMKVSSGNRFDASTRDAVWEYQTANAAQKLAGLIPDGIVGPATWSALTGLDPARLLGLLHVGDNTQEVRWVQRVLDHAGRQPGPIDGVYGRNTESAVKRLQEAAGIDVDGIVGPDTRRALRRHGARELGSGFKSHALAVTFVGGLPVVYANHGSTGLSTVDAVSGELLSSAPDATAIVVPLDAPKSLAWAAGETVAVTTSGDQQGRRFQTVLQPQAIAAAAHAGEIEILFNNPSMGEFFTTTSLDRSGLRTGRFLQLFRHEDDWCAAWLDEKGALNRAGASFDEKSAPPFTGGDGPFEEMTIGGTSDDAFLVTRAFTGLVEKWVASTGEVIHGGTNPDGEDAVVIAGGRSVVVVGSRSGVVRVFDRVRWEQIGPSVAIPGRAIVRLAVAQDGDALAIAALDERGTVFGWTQRRLSTGRTEFVHDQPALVDQLGRQNVASEMAHLMRSLSTGGDRADAFAIHLDGKWGEGKSTVVRFLADDLRSPTDGSPPWVVAQMDAWRSSQMSPAWWALLSHLRQAVRESKTPIGKRWFSFRLTCHEMMRARKVWLPMAVVVLFLVALWILRTDVTAIAGTATALAAAVVAVGAFGSRFLSLGTLQGARLHERINENPMAEVADQILWIRRRCRQPILLVLDDLDRCNEQFTVEVLDAVQTLIRSPALDHASREAHRSDTPTLVILAVGDQRWLRAAYEESYSVFKPFVAERGRPLGHLFLNKLFQVRVELPKLETSQFQGYLDGLLGVREGRSDPDVQDQTKKLQRAASESSDGATSFDDAISRMVNSSAEQTAEERHELTRVALEIRRNDAGREHRERRLLEQYAELLDRNPRSAKRFLMSYNMAYATRLSELAPFDPETLALWTVLALRWPALADWIRDELPNLSLQPAGEDGHPSALLENQEVQRVLNSRKGGPLDEARIRRCCGVIAAGAD